MIEIDRNWFNTNSKEAQENDKCLKSYSEEHSFIPFNNGLKCVICNKEFRKREAY